MIDKNKFEIIELDKYKLGPDQIVNTYEYLEKQKQEGWNKISQIRKLTQDSENRRNIENGLKHDERMVLLRKLEESIPVEMQEIEARLREVMEIEQADELQVQFEKFKEQCERVVQKKNQIILEYSKQLDYKDQLYVDSLKKFRTDIELMIKLMRDQFLNLRDEMLVYLELTEKKFNEDRKKFIGEYKKGIEELIRKLNETEDDKERALTNLEDELEDKAKKDAYKAEMEYINKVIIMEKHSNFLKETIEDFTYEVKILSERLDYRVEVRDEKIKENEEKKAQYERWDLRLGERIRESYQIYKEKDLENRIKNAQLKEELMKMADSYEKLKEKFQHFEKYDDLRFKDIYDMKSKEAKELALKVALAERTIRTQQLGMEIVNNENAEGFSLEELQKEQDLEEESVDEKDKVNEEEMKMKNILNSIPSERVKQVFSYIIQEAEFLIEMDVINGCIEMSEAERLPRYIESICKALNIKNEQELNQLLSLFDKHNMAEKQQDIKVTEESANESGEENRSRDKENYLIIDPDIVLDLLKEFYNEKKIKSKEQSNNKIINYYIKLVKENITSNAFSLGEDNEEVKRERMKYLSVVYWIKLGKIISEKTFNVWKALDRGLTNYHDLLFERKKLVEDVKGHYDKNKDLKKLLNQYMQSDDNKALKVPPYQTIKRVDLNFALSDI